MEVQLLTTLEYAILVGRVLFFFTIEAKVYRFLKMNVSFCQLAFSTFVM